MDLDWSRIHKSQFKRENKTMCEPKYVPEQIVCDPNMFHMYCQEINKLCVCVCVCVCEREREREQCVLDLLEIRCPLGLWDESM